MADGYACCSVNPFRGKTAEKLHQMFIYRVRGTDPISGKVSYVNKSNKRRYRIGPSKSGKYRKLTHVHISKPKIYKGNFEKNGVFR